MKFITMLTAILSLGAFAPAPARADDTLQDYLERMTCNNEAGKGRSNRASGDDDGWRGG
ncbi:hypothetical protein [Agrobacterium rubi]|uniref:hypothetical protein n=1 Tax=Agrobacterium rubi TaxID=28099 RepID=UPI00201B69DA|nr:hypothetical protein [Agrobacterium rubi]